MPNEALRAAMTAARITDDEMLVCTRIAGLAGHDSPMIHLQRCQDGGLFDRYAYHVSELWKAARPADLASRQSPGRR